MSLFAITTEESRTAFEFAGLPAGWGRLLALLTLVGLCYAVFWLYRREGRAGASSRVRYAMAVVRCAVVLLLAAIWLEPTMATYLKRTLRGTVLVLVDASASMGIAEGARDATTGGGGSGDGATTRIDQVRQLLSESDYAWLKKLESRNQLAVYTFGDNAQRVRLPWESLPTSQSDPSRARKEAASDPSRARKEAGSSADESQTRFLTGAARSDAPADKAVGFGDAFAARENHTDLGQALNRAIADASDGPIAGVVVISDGIVNQGLAAEDLVVAARTAGTSVYAVGVGQDAEPPNVRITSFSTPATVSKGDPIEIRVEVSAAGIEATPVKLELTARPVAAGADAERVLASRDITVGGEQATVEQRFRIETDAPGEFIYRARVTPLPVEAVTFDNLRASSVLVVDDQLRVLLVASRPTFDYRAVVSLLSRDKTINLSCWLQSADSGALRDGTTPIDELPRKSEDLFAYDVILLMDPDPREFDSSWALNVRRLVDELGGGVLLQAGPFFTGRFLRDERLSDLASILPIAPDPDAEVRLSERGSFHTQATPLRVPDDARGHPILQLHPDPGVNRAVWESLTGAWWFLPVLREKPLAAVLLRGGGSLANLAGDARGASAGGGASPILMAAQPFGAGRTLYLGFDGTWRWRGAAERYFNRYWVQVVRYLAQARRQGVSRRGSIVLDRETYDVGNVAKIEARVLDSSFAPVQDAEIAGELELSDGSREPVRLAPIAGREGWFSGRATLDMDGPTVVRIPLTGGKPGESLIKHAQVQRPDVEMRTLRLRADSLTHLAEKSQGKYVSIANARNLPDEIRDASQVKSERGPRHALWDRGWVLGLISALLGIEWFVRRRNHLL